jgi:hypothetical protein
VLTRRFESLRQGNQARQTASVCAVALEVMHMYRDSTHSNTIIHMQAVLDHGSIHWCCCALSMPCIMLPSCKAQLCGGTTQHQP